ncbi:riboflavin biosynthesis protein RibF [Verrucomicrobiota bacterium]
MNVLHQYEQPKDCPIVIAAGCFDGVHLGHQAVIGEAVKQAKEQGGEAWVMTFDPHPARVLNPNTAPPLLSSQTTLFRHFEELGVSGVFLVPFTREFISMLPEEFATDLVKRIPKLAGFVTGTDWCFGRRAAGNVTLLRELWQERGIRVTGVEAVNYDGERISSTRIRHAILAGELKTAARLLNRPFSVFGKVVHGREVGRKLGFPTANIEVQNEVEPPPGIYAVKALLDGTLYPAAAYIGSRKTFHNIGDERVLEVYLLDFDGQIYDHEVEVLFVEKIREDTAFESVEALKEQIAIDIAQIRKIL